MIVPIFNRHICIFDFELHDRFIGRQQSYTIINELLSSPDVLSKENVPDAEGGRALSTVHLCDKYHIPTLLNFKHNILGKWILQRILESAYDLGYDKYRDVRRLKFHRTWVNKMGKNCDALAHRHANEGWTIPHLVAIYYLDVPENSADLIFINDTSSIMRGGHAKDYKEVDQVKVKAKTGRLVCHDAKEFHATSVHKNDLTRTCLILEVGFAPLKQ
ncbi:putative 2OG-Fe(II) oxygenase [Pseudoalteromonas arctica]|uniref:Uncharacterized protein n=1 Tax=Pseudoalteromonas arctica TaxID=394751 RepID=A0A7Y0DRE8_9GAMM|nr:putative 2OG-Fe(II) oxygenase [Pseudoalteromonas arctica]NMM40290.1 hypothetical protein [Pseudoalteromonas arctica]